MSLPSNMTWPPVDQFYIVISLCLFVIGISLVLVYDWYYFLGLRTMRRAVTHFTRTWIMWSKVLAQRHTHTESPPTFFIPLNCKTKQTRSFIFFFVTHMYKNLFFDILHVLRIVMLLLCVCENVCVRFSLLNVWSIKVEKSMCFHFVCYLIYTDTCPLIYIIYTPLSIWVHLHVLLQRRACVLTFEVYVCYFWRNSLHTWYHLHIFRWNISMSLRYLFRVNINIQLSIYIIFCKFVVLTRQKMIWLFTLHL